MDLNKVFLIGRLTQDPQLRTTPSGQSVCSFGMATNRVRRDQNTGETIKSTEYHNIVLWRRLAEIAAQYLTKGSLVLIEGRLQTRSWQDSSGVRKYRTEIITESLQLGPKFSQRNEGERNFISDEKKEIKNNEEIPVIDDNEEEIDIKDIPF